MTASQRPCWVCRPGWRSSWSSLSPRWSSSAFVGFVFPGEIALLLGGVLAEQGDVSLLAVLALGFAGAVLGDSVGVRRRAPVGTAHRRRHPGSTGQAGSFRSRRAVPGRSRRSCRVPRPAHCSVAGHGPGCGRNGRDAVLDVRRLQRRGRRGLGAPLGAPRVLRGQQLAARRARRLTSGARCARRSATAVRCRRGVEACASYRARRPRRTTRCRVPGGPGTVAARAAPGWCVHRLLPARHVRPGRRAWRRAAVARRRPG